MGEGSQGERYVARCHHPAARRASVELAALKSRGGLGSPVAPELAYLQLADAVCSFVGYAKQALNG